MKNHVISSEHDIQNQLIEFINYQGIMAWRFNSGMAVTGEGNKRRMIRMGIAGMPDVMGIIGSNFKGGKYYGRFIAIEVKRPNKKPTDIQQRMMTELAKYGAIVFVSHSLNELQEQLKGL